MVLLEQYTSNGSYACSMEPKGPREYLARRQTQRGQSFRSVPTGNTQVRQKRESDGLKKPLKRLMISSHASFAVIIVTSCTYSTGWIS